MDDKSVLQVLHGALHPVVEWSRSFGKLKVQLVDGFKQLLGSLWSIERKRLPDKFTGVSLTRKVKRRGSIAFCGGFRVMLFKQKLPNLRTLKDFSGTAGILKVSLHRLSL